MAAADVHSRGFACQSVKTAQNECTAADYGEQVASRQGRVRVGTLHVAAVYRDLPLAETANEWVHLHKGEIPVEEEDANEGMPSFVDQYDDDLGNITQGRRDQQASRAGPSM